MSSLRHAPAFMEHDWNARALATPVTAPQLRAWLYARPALVLGPSQRSDAALDERARAAGVEVVGRASGGGAVLAGPWLLGLSVVLPPDHPRVVPSLRASYRWLGEALAAWLGGLGVAARAVGEPPPAKDRAIAWSCFAGVSHWEVTAGERKIVGLAQARRRTGVLFSAGVLVAPTPWELLCALMGRPAELAPELARRTTSMTEVLGTAPAPDDLAGGLLAAVGAAIGAW